MQKSDAGITESIKMSPVVDEDRMRPGQGGRKDIRSVPLFTRSPLPEQVEEEDTSRESADPDLLGEIKWK